MSKQKQWVEKHKSDPNPKNLLGKQISDSVVENRLHIQSVTCVEGENLESKRGI